MEHLIPESTHTDIGIAWNETNAQTW